MIKIKQIPPNKKKDIEKLKNKEWKRFDKEVDYAYKEKVLSFVASENNRFLGYIKIRIIGNAAYLKELIVKKEARNRGVGGFLIKKFEEIARKNKCHVAYLETSERHSEALKFYKKHGYKIAAKLKNNKFHLTWYFLEKKLK